MTEHTHWPSSLRIGLLTHSVNPRGGVVHTLELAHALHDMGHRVTVMAPASPGQQLFRPMPCAVDLIPVGPTPVDMAEMVASRIDAVERHLSAMLNTQAFDVLHAQDPISANALARVQDRGLIKDFVRTVHHLDTFDDPRLMAWQESGFMRASRVLCVSELWRGVLKQTHGIDAALVHNGVDCLRYTPVRDETDAIVAQRYGLRPGVAANAPVFLAVGGVEERKNTQRILQAFIEAQATWPQAQLVIAGGASLLNHDAYARQFMESLRSSGLSVGAGQSVLITGPVPDDHMPALFRAADALLMPSLREGFGLVVLEALASGTPVVVSLMAPFTEYLGEGDAVWADPLDVHSMAEAMHRALDPARATALAREPPAVCQRFSWQASARRHLALYRAFHTFQENPHACHALSPSLA
jgi:glycosyltransferase-like protein